MPPRIESKAGLKSDETRDRILNAALELFDERGFDSATMRDIAEHAGVATGAAYYYFASKDAIVLEFYQRSCAEMQPKIGAALDGVSGLDRRLREMIRVKLAHFAPRRGVLRALLRNGADPSHPLSPFSAQTAALREIDLAWFGRILDDCGVRIPKDLAPHLPPVLWLFQMGVIFFWLVDESREQARASRLLALASKNVAMLIRLSALPLMRPVRRTAIELIEVVSGGDAR
jgi:AcrR family transcriptional regulator